MRARETCAKRVCAQGWVDGSRGLGHRTQAGLRAHLFVFALELEVLDQKHLADHRILRQEEGSVVQKLVHGRRVRASSSRRCSVCKAQHRVRTRCICCANVRGRRGCDRLGGMRAAHRSFCGRKQRRLRAIEGLRHRCLEPTESLKRWRSRRSRRRCARRHTCRMWRTHKDATARLGGQSVLYARPARTRTQKSSIADLPGVKTTHSQYSVFCHKRTVRTPRRDSESNRGYRGLSQPILGLVHRGKPSTSPWDSDNVPECISDRFF